MRMLIVFAIAFGMFCVASCEEDVVVKTQYGWVKGSKEQTVIDNTTFYSFKGIPYAQPPLGKLRFLAPIPPKKWRHIRDATVLREECAYIEFLSEKLRGSEDCLYLNVYTPNLNIESDDDTDARTDKSHTTLPVIVYFSPSYEKSFNLYTPSKPDFLVSKDVVIVTFEYRLKGLGLLNLETKEVPGNAALKDQVIVLKWVKHNIEEFGGNPNCVTLLGSSFSADCILLHTVSHMSAGLFHKAIIMSGEFEMFSNCSKAKYMKEKSFSLGKNLGYDTENGSLLLELLQDVPCKKLLSHKFTFSPSIEKKCGQDIFLDKDPAEALKFGNVHVVDVMFSYSDQEALIFLRIFNNLHMDEAALMVKFYNSNEFINILQTLCLSTEKYSDLKQKVKYYYTGGNATIQNLSKIIKETTYAVFVTNNIKIARQWSRFAKTYFFKFSSYSSRSVTGLYGKKYGIVGAGYLDILNYIFYSPSLTLKEGSLEHKMVNQLTTALTYFAKYSEPSPDCVMGVEWPTFDKKVQAYAEFTDEINIYSFLDDDDIEFWQEIYESLNLEF